MSASTAGVLPAPPSEVPATAAPSSSWGVAPDQLHACPTDPDCPHCAGVTTYDWTFVDAVYCISLASRHDRAALAAAELHRVGLCRHTRFYRPQRHPTSVVEGIWESHRAVAAHALQQGARRALILEDDVAFARWVRPGTIRAVADAMRRLPDGWAIFFLGHWPLRARFVRRNVVRTASGCAHAYVASERLLTWLRDTPFSKQNRQREQIIGGGIDASYASMDGAFAYVPMLATQAVRGSDHMAHKKRKRHVRRLRHVITRTSLGEVLLSNLMRPNELLQLGVAAVAAAGSLLRRPFGRDTAPPDGPG